MALRTKVPMDRQDLEALSDLPFVQDGVIRTDEMGLRVVVDEASTAVPALLEWCKARRIAVESIEEYMPPFDDVFVELVKEGNGYA